MLYLLSFMMQLLLRVTSSLLLLSLSWGEHTDTCSPAGIDLERFHTSFSIRVLVMCRRPVRPWSEAINASNLSIQPSNSTTSDQCWIVLFPPSSRNDNHKHYFVLFTEKLNGSLILMMESEKSRRAQAIFSRRGWNGGVREAEGRGRRETDQFYHQNGLMMKKT